MKELFIKIKTWWVSIPRKTILGKILHLLVIGINWILVWTGKFFRWMFASEVLNIALSVVVFKRVSAFWGVILFCISVYFLVLAIHNRETK